MIMWLVMGLQLWEYAAGVKFFVLNVASIAPDLLQTSTVSQRQFNHETNARIQLFGIGLDAGRARRQGDAPRREG